MNMLKVLAVICDGASPNRKLFKMYFHMTTKDEMNPDVDVTYLFSPEKRFIYFISNVTDLLKTARNFLPNSGSGKFTRYMWNGGLLLL